MHKSLKRISSILTILLVLCCEYAAYVPFTKTNDKFWKPLLVIYPRGLLPVVALIGGSARTGYLFQGSGI